MLKTIRHNGESGQIAILLALAMIGLLGMVGLALDGGMLYWNQRRAQNGADAAVVAGTTSLVQQYLTEGFDCNIMPAVEQPILDLAHEYAAINDVPEADAGKNIEVYYLTEDSAGNRYDLINAATGKPWIVGTTGFVPCMPDYPIVGLHVKANYPQDTFLAGVVGIAKTDVTVNAYAIWEHRSWCTDFALFGIDGDPGSVAIKVNGSNVSITNGGLHSNGNMQLSANAGDLVSLEPGRPVEYNADTDEQYLKVNFNKVEGGPDDSAPYSGFTGVESYPLPDDFFYDFGDFAPPTGFIWNETDSSKRYYIDGDLTNSNLTVDANGKPADGLYVVTGKVKLNNIKPGEDATPWHATIVAKEEVAISGGFRQAPYTRGIFIYTESDNDSVGAVNLSGDGNKWAGLIVAPNGNVSMSGAQNSDLSGMVVAQEIEITGSNNSINHRPEFCPPEPPRVLLLQ